MKNSSMCLVLNSDGSVEESTEIPKYYLSDADFNNMLINVEAVKAIVSRLGDRVTIGNLGTLTAEGYVETNVQIGSEIDEPDQGDLSFYTKLQSFR